MYYFFWLLLTEEQFLGMFKGKKIVSNFHPQDEARKKKQKHKYIYFKNDYILYNFHWNDTCKWICLHHFALQNICISLHGYFQVYFDPFSALWQLTYNSCARYILVHMLFGVWCILQTSNSFEWFNYIMMTTGIKIIIFNSIRLIGNPVCTWVCHLISWLVFTHGRW